MTSAEREKGARAEREVAALLTDATGLTITRRLQEGRAGDTGDLEGLHGWCIQVRNYRDVMRAIREGLPDLERQQARKGCPHGAVLVRRYGGRWVAVMDIEQFAAVLRATEARHERGQE
jgi:hypothetical protein